MWTFLVRPYLSSLWQFRQIVRLYRQHTQLLCSVEGDGARAPPLKMIRRGWADADYDGGVAGMRERPEGCASALIRGGAVIAGEANLAAAGEEGKGTGGALLGDMFCNDGDDDY